VARGRQAACLASAAEAGADFALGRRVRVSGRRRLGGRAWLARQLEQARRRRPGDRGDEEGRKRRAAHEAALDLGRRALASEDPSAVGGVFASLALSLRARAVAEADEEEDSEEEEEDDEDEDEEAEAAAGAGGRASGD